MHDDFILSLVVIIMGLLFVASVVAIAARKARFPYTIALVIIGLLMGWASKRVEFLHPLSSFRLSPEVVLFVFLPVLLFESAFNMNARSLLKNILPVATLAVPGLLISTAVVGFMLHYLLSLPFGVALLFGSLISATDPVAVVSLFKEMGAPKRLGLLVEGESLFNDGTALVVFKIILAAALAGGITASSLALGVLDFVVVVTGGIAVGIGFGVLFSKMIEMVENDRLVEITLTTILAHSTFLTADHVLHVSGVIATVTAGLTMGSYGINKVSPPVLKHMESFWEYFAFICNSLIFLLVGLSVDPAMFVENFSAIIWAAVAVTAARALGVYGLVPLIGMGGIVEKIDARVQTVIFWGGLRGALAIVMALSIPEGFPHRDYLLVLTLGVVVLSIVINGLTVKRLMSLLGLDRYSIIERYERSQAIYEAGRRTLGEADSFVQENAIGRGAADKVKKKFAGEMDGVRAELEELKKDVSAEDESRLVLRHSLMLERKNYRKMFEEGLLSEDNLRDMLVAIERELDRVKEGGGVYRKGRPPILSRLAMRLTGMPVLGRALKRYKTARIAAGYEMERARYACSSAVLEALGRMKEEGTVSGKAAARALELYTGLREKAESRIEAIRGQYPEYVEKADIGILERYCLGVEAEAYREIHSKGAITDKVMTDLGEAIEGRARKMRLRPVRELLMPPSELIARVPYFRDLGEEELRGLTSKLQATSCLMGEVIVGAGDEGDSMFIIGRGEVEVLGKDGTPLARLGPGNFFGEAALLHPQPRTATVRAATPCTLLELGRKALAPHLEFAPRLKEVLEDAYRKRVLIRGLVAGVPMFSQLGPADMDEVVSRAEHAALDEGAYAARQGDNGGVIFMVAEGGLEVIKDGESTGTIGPGGHFGAETFLKHEPMGASLRAAERTEIYRLDIGRLRVYPDIIKALGR